VILFQTRQPPGPVPLAGFVIAFGLLELVLGTFLSYVVYPTCTVSVALASLLTIFIGVPVSVLGSQLVLLILYLCLAAGAICLAYGSARSVRAWVDDSRE
jgi:hypothetical protein